MQAGIGLLFSWFETMQTVEHLQQLQVFVGQTSNDTKEKDDDKPEKYLRHPTSLQDIARNGVGGPWPVISRAPAVLWPLCDGSPAIPHPLPLYTCVGGESRRRAGVSWCCVGESVDECVGGQF